MTAPSQSTLGYVLAAGAIGGVVGGVTMSLWGGFKRRTHGVLAGWMAACFSLAFVGVGVWLPLWVAGMAILIFFSSLVGIGAGLMGYLNPYTHNAETILPDHDAV